MFNGIIYNQGTITKILKRPMGLNIFVKSKLKLNSKDIGLSVACDGVCLTLISYKNNIMEFYLSNETIVRSKFNFLKAKDKINSSQYKQATWILNKGQSKTEAWSQVVEVKHI